MPVKLVEPNIITNSPSQLKIEETITKKELTERKISLKKNSRKFSDDKKKRKSIFRGK